MDWLKRALFNLNYHKGRTLIHVLILIILALSFAAAWGVNNSVKREIYSLGCKIDTWVSIKKSDHHWDMEKESSYISFDDANKLADSKYVSGVSCFARAKANGVEISGIVPEYGLQPNKRGSVVLIGIDNPKDYFLFSEGTSISQGRSFSKEDSDESYAIVSEMFAKNNEIGLGDTIKLHSTFNDKKIQLEIIGLHTGNFVGGYDITSECNFIYTPVKNVSDITGGGTFSAKYKIKSANELNYFVDEIEHYTATNNIKLDILKDMSDYMIAIIPFQGIEKMSQGIMISLGILGLVIQIVLTLFSVLEQRREIGILYSIGERRGKILLQVIFESSLPVIVGIILGCMIIVGNLRIMDNLIYEIELGFIVEIVPIILCVSTFVSATVALVISSGELVRSPKYLLQNDK